MTDERDPEQEREPKQALDPAYLGGGLAVVLVAAHFAYVEFFMERSGDFPEFDLLAVGFIQIAYLIPLAIALGVRKRERMGHGVFVVSGFTFMMTGLLCGGMFMTG